MINFTFPALVFLLLLAGAVLRREKTAFGGGLLLFDGVGTDDDSDMKIAGGPAHPAETDDAGRELEQQRLSGNLAKARVLSAELAKKIIDEDGENSFGSDEQESDEIRTQRRLLLAFVVDFAVSKFISSSILGKVVINQFYDNLKKNVPEFYEDIRESGSFSFYYLCMRGNNNIQSCVGGSFAMLTGHEDDRLMGELGEALFIHFIDIVEQAIKACDFDVTPSAE
ncbi:MAG: hypothetical protein P4M02_09845 [Clostridia bacterium]|nr:hypothetical protein [Clostridia bacterium]